MLLKNYYNTLSISEKSTNEEIKNAAKILFENIKKSNNKNKKYILKNIIEAYEILYNQNKRKIYDRKLSKQKKLNKINNYYQNSLLTSFSNNNIIDKFKIYDFPINTNINKINQSNSKGSYYHTCYTNSYHDKNGNLITEKKLFTKNNNKIYANHTITTIDKYGNKRIKKIPIKNYYKIY
jgi:DnaJ-class molecular chaperone